MTAWALLGLLGFSVLSATVAVAQDDRPRRRANRSATEQAASRRETGGSAERHFFESFPNATPGRRNWELTIGVTPAQGLSDAEQAAGAVQLALTAEAGRSPELCSVPIPLGGLPGVELAYTIGQRGVESGEALLVEYFAADGRWSTLERVVADGRDSAGFSRHVRMLPVAALHDEFRVRFRPDVNDDNDAWLIGEVSVAGYDPLRTLEVRVQPARAAQVELLLAGRPDGDVLSAPFARRLPVGSRLFLVAAPAIDAGVFSHWSVGGIRVQRQRVLPLEMTEAVSAVAHYRRSVAGRDEASVAIVSRPLPGVPISIGIGSEMLASHVLAETEYACLTGEWLTLLAPPRTDRMVFVGWVVNGERVAANDSFLEHCVTGDDVLLAEYVLLGDVNGDDVLDKYDVDLFVAALIDPVGYAEVYPELDRLQRGDINGDGAFDALDVEGFVDLLLND
jgi:hypothetical protein